MGSKRRNKLEIVNDILRAIQQKGGKIKPTHLLYKSNLSHNRMKEYLDHLHSRKLISNEYDKDKLMILLTEEGYKFLENFNKLKEFTEAFGL